MVERERISRVARSGRGANSGSSCSGVNDGCHGWIGTMDANEGHVMAHPKVYAIYWDDVYFHPGPTVDLMNQFLGDILTSDYFMKALQQYGVNQGQFVGYTVIPQGMSPAPAVLSKLGIQNQLSAWIANGTVPIGPTPNEENLLYVIFTPHTTVLASNGSDVAFEPSECLCGIHDSGRYTNAKGADNLFWAIIQEWHNHPALPGSPHEFVGSCSWCVSHEMVEAFTNRDGQGYQNDNQCEIGDVCECSAGSEDHKTPIIKVEISVEGRNWYVQPYWDNANQSCYPLHIVPLGKTPKRHYEFPKNPRASHSRE
jgi:hypothetical protein